MNPLVTYVSSDDEDDASSPKQLPAPDVHSKPHEGANAASLPIEDAATILPSPGIPTASVHEPLPVPGPSAAPVTASAFPEDSDLPPLSPYTFERQRLRELTMPPLPTFEIPVSPAPPPRNSEEAAALAGTTKKFERFLDLKKQGIHFNERLHNSTSLRNPSLLIKLMHFADISQEESYASSLGEGLAVPVKWPAECYLENLLKYNDQTDKKRPRGREAPDFVPAKVSDDTLTLQGPRKKSKFAPK